MNFITANAHGIPILSVGKSSQNIDQRCTFTDKAKFCQYLLLNRGLWIQSTSSDIFHFRGTDKGTELLILEAKYGAHSLFVIINFSSVFSLETHLSLKYMRVQLKKLKSDHISNILESIDAYVARAVDGGTFLDSIGDSSQLEDIIMDPSWQDFVNELETSVLSPYLSDNCKAYAELIIEPTTSPWFPTDLAIGTIILLEDGVKSSRWITFHHDDEIIDERLNINQVLSSLPTCSIAHFVESMQTRYHLIIVQGNVACIFVTSTQSIFSEELAIIILKRPEGEQWRVEQPLDRVMQPDVAAGVSQYLSFLNDKLV